MPAELDVLKQYVQGKKYKHQAEWYSYDFSKYKAHYIFPGRQPRTMYCQVTKTTLNQIPAEIEHHIRGRKYLAAKTAYEAQLERTKAANARRDEKQRTAKAKGQTWSGGAQKSDEGHASDDDAEELPVISAVQQESKKAWHDDLSDLYPSSRHNRQSDDEEEELSEDMMEFLSDLAESDEEEHSIEKGADDDQQSEASEDSVPSKSKSKSKKSHSSKDSASRSKTRKEDKKKSRSQDRLSQAIEEDLAPKHSKMKHRTKKHKESRG